MICILTAGKTLTLAAGAFTLAWTHSVEKTRWEEHWIAGPEGLTVTQGAIEGSGAGMDPPPDAVLKDGAYVYTPHVPAIPELILAASGATGAGWTLCPVRSDAPTLSGFRPALASRSSQDADGVAQRTLQSEAAVMPGCLALGTRREAPIHVRWCPADYVADQATATKGAVDDPQALNFDVSAPIRAAARPHP